MAILQRKIRTPMEQRKYRALWWPSRRIQLDAFRMDDAHVEQFLDEWARTKPRIFVGYVGGIVELATLLLDRGISPHPPTAIATTAAPLTEAHRSLIQNAFKAPVYDHYRSSEVPWIAGECRERNGLHVFADVRKVEIVGPDGKPVQPGETGEVVASDLTNRVFPLIRYRLGDRTSEIVGECPCGITLPRICPVAGRVTDNFRLPDGRIVPGEPLAQTFSRTPDAVRQFQIHQLADYSIVVRCVPNDTPGARAAIDQAMARFRDIFASEVPIRLELLETIPHDGGKIRFIMSDAR
jgi:phenylacetate-CoA ligase